MNTSKIAIENELTSLLSDIEKCEKMSEAEMQEYFNTDDSKEEFMKVLASELSFYEKEYKEAEEEESDSSEVDCGFADMDDYINYKYY